MSRSEVIDFLAGYARSFSAPVYTGVTVNAVRRDDGGFRVETTAGTWIAPNVVLATGYCDRPYVPAAAAELAPGIAQVVPSRYRNPGQLRAGSVLVVGASSTGIQLASEIARSGRRVTLAVGRHTRLPRRYRGRDILAWFDALGVSTESAAHVGDLAASRRQPSLQLIGSDDHRSLDLATLQEQGVRIVGHLAGVRGRRVYLADDLRPSIEHADAKMHEQLDRVDEFIERSGRAHEFPMEARPAPVRVPATPTGLDLAAEGIQTVLWATGYRRDYAWLRVPVLDAHGELQHEGGITAAPGLYALGLYFMRRRNSSLLDGVGTDAAELADHIAGRLARAPRAAA